MDIAGAGADKFLVDGIADILFVGKPGTGLQIERQRQQTTQHGPQVATALRSAEGIRQFPAEAAGDNKTVEHGCPFYRSGAGGGRCLAKLDGRIEDFEASKIDNHGRFDIVKTILQQAAQDGPIIFPGFDLV